MDLYVCILKMHTTPILLDVFKIYKGALINMKNLKNSLFISLIIGLSLSLFFSMLFADGKYYPLNPQSTIGIWYYTNFTETTVMLISIILWLLIGVVFFLEILSLNTQIGALLKQL